MPPTHENDPRFRSTSSFTFADKLAAPLYHGGAYHKAHGSGVEEMQLAERSAHELIQDRFPEVLVFVNHPAWTDFFFISCDLGSAQVCLVAYQTRDACTPIRIFNLPTCCSLSFRVTLLSQYGVDHLWQKRVNAVAQRHWWVVRNL